MKLSIRELRAFLETEATELQIATVLTDIGLEIEASDCQDNIYDNFVVGKVIAVEMHPKSKKLHVCKVDIGAKELQIACGASNVREGMFVIVSLLGAKIPATGLVIEKRAVCGVESEGMLCSWEELDLAAQEDGNHCIAELISDHITLPTKISDLLDTTPILEVNITPNRGDCMGLYGIARDLVAAGIGKLRPLSANKMLASLANSQTKARKILGESLVPLLARAEIRKVAIICTPLHLRRQLKIADLVITGNIVRDLASIVAWRFGVPICVHDADKIFGDLKLGHAQNNENFIDANGKAYILDESALVLRDSENTIISLPGLIGSAVSAVCRETSNIYLESGLFSAKDVAKLGQKLGIRSDLRFRYERGIDPALIKIALNWYSNQVAILCGGELEYLQCQAGQDEVMRKIPYSTEIFQRIMNYSIKKDRMLEMLQGLQFVIENTDDPDVVNVSPPPYRYDINISEDITEELARINGYHNIPLIPDSALYYKKTREHTSHGNDYYKQLKLCKLLTSLGYTEVVNFAFTAQKKAGYFRDVKKELILQNPVSEQMNYMRPTLLSGLLDNLLLNISYNSKESLSFFEIGKVFYGTAIEQQRDKLSVVRYGNKIPKSHLHNAEEYSFFDIKSDLYAILEHFQVMTPDELDFALTPISEQENTLQSYHPYRTFVISQEDNSIKYPLMIGELHPRLLKNFDIDRAVQFLEIDLEWLQNRVMMLPKVDFFPRITQPIFRNIAFLFKELPLLGRVVIDIKKVSDSIQEVSVVDIYNIEDVSGIVQYSVNFGLELWRSGDSFTAKDINLLFRDIVHLMQTKYAAALRGTVGDDIDQIV